MEDGMQASIFAVIIQNILFFLSMNLLFLC